MGNSYNIRWRMWVTLPWRGPEHQRLFNHAERLFKNAPYLHFPYCLQMVTARCFCFLLFVCFTLALSLSETLDESNISPAKNKRWYLLHSHPLIQQALGREPNQCALIQIFNTVFEDTHISYSVLWNRKMATKKSHL